MSDSPAGSQPNDTFGISGLNWRGAAGPAAGGPAPGRARRHGQGRDRGRGQHRGAGHAGPAPAQARPAARTTSPAWPAPGHRRAASHRTTPQPAAAATTAWPRRTRYIRRPARGSPPAATDHHALHTCYRRAAPHPVVTRGKIHSAPCARPGPAKLPQHARPGEHACRLARSARGPTPNSAGRSPQHGQPARQRGLITGSGG